MSGATALFSLQLQQNSLEFMNIPYQSTLWTRDRSCIEFSIALTLNILKGSRCSTLTSKVNMRPPYRRYGAIHQASWREDSQLGFSSETSKSAIVMLNRRVRWMLHTSLQDMFTTCSPCIELRTMAGLLSWRCRNCQGIGEGSMARQIKFFCFNSQWQISLELLCLALLRPGLQTSCWKPRQVWV